MKNCSFVILLAIIFYSLQTNFLSQNIPAPDSVNARYGTYAMNTYDLWKAKSEKPTPLVIYIHGGSFAHGDKSKISESVLTGLLNAGISYMAINYRLTPEVSYPQHYYDCARAVQFVRYHAQELHIDANRIALTGSSAGGCTSLWLAFHDDLADPKNEDPVLHMSTRVTCAVTNSGQSTLEPDVIREIVGELALKNSMFNGKFLGVDSTKLESATAKELYKAASPVTYLTKEDPPVWMYYSAPKAPATTTSEAIHHYNFGRYLKEKMDKLGMECVLLDKESATTSVTKSTIEFFVKQFGMQLRKNSQDD